MLGRAVQGRLLLLAAAMRALRAVHSAGGRAALGPDSAWQLVVAAGSACWGMRGPAAAAPAVAVADLDGDLDRANVVRPGVAAAAVAGGVDDGWAAVGLAAASAQGSEDASRPLLPGVVGPLPGVPG